MTNIKITLAAAGATMFASLSLYPIFSGPSWFWSGAGAVIAVAIGGILTRLRRLPVVLGPVGGLACLLVYLNFRFEPARSYGLVVPSPGSLQALWHLVGQGMNDASAYAPPVPPTRGLLLLASAGIGITAVLVDLIAVRLSSAAIAGLPLLMLFTEPFAVDVSRGSSGTAIVFCLGAAGYLTLLSLDGRQRIRAWGRIAGPSFMRADTTALATTGRRVGLASVVVALCVPLLMPGLHAARIFQGNWSIGGSGAGTQTISLPSPVTQLHDMLNEGPAQVVLTYRTTDPHASMQYLQEYVLNNLTDDGWQLLDQQLRTSPVSPGLPQPPGLNRAATPATISTTVVTFAQNVGSNPQSIVFLPLPYPSLTLTGSGSWLADPLTLMTLARNIRLGGFSYQVTSLHLNPSTNELASAPPPPSSLSALTDVPASYDSLARLADQITRGAKTELDRANALQEYLSTTGGYSYTLNAPTVTDAHSLATFLLSSKHGYCEQFAFAMTVLARLLGIPARYAVGYTAGNPTKDGTWVVRTSDAHAWPELYFTGVGWLRFEPTPSGAGGQGTATAPSYANLPNIPGTPGGPNTGTTVPPANTTHGGGHSTNPHLRGGSTGPYGSGLPTAGGHQAHTNVWLLIGLGALALLALALIALILPGLIRILVRPLRWRGTADDPAAAAGAAWNQLLADLADHRTAARPSESPRTLAARLSTELALAAPAAAAVQRIALAAERARYSASPTDPDGLRKDAAMARRAIAAASGRRARWMARILPASVLRPTMAGVLHMLDVMNRIGHRRPRTPVARPA